MQDHVVFNYNQITDHIYLGTNQCCVTHFDENLLNKGVTLDVSMEAERMDRAGGVEYYLWLPTVDHTAPTFQRLSMGVVAMQDAIARGESVYVHCKNGHGRGPTMVAAYLIKEVGMTADEAVEAVRVKREEIHLEGNQLEQLKAWEEVCKKA